MPVLLVLLLSANPQWFDSADGALKTVLKAKGKGPRVIAIGEIHQTKALKGVPSAISRFNTALASVAPQISDLVVETWYTNEQCGEVEEKTVSDIKETTERPEATGNEILDLGRRAKALGIRPWALEFSCADYESVFKEEVDYGRLLSLVTSKLKDRVKALLKKRKGSKRAIVIYGGAMHNDLQPDKDLAEYSFAAELKKAARGRYIELDLYVPEYLALDEDVKKEPWYARWKKSKRPGKIALFSRGPRSWALVFQEQPR